MYEEDLIFRLVSEGLVVFHLIILILLYYSKTKITRNILNLVFVLFNCIGIYGYFSEVFKVGIIFNINTFVSVILIIIWVLINLEKRIIEKTIKVLVVLCVFLILDLFYMYNAFETIKENQWNPNYYPINSFEKFYIQSKIDTITQYSTKVSKYEKILDGIEKDSVKLREIRKTVYFQPYFNFKEKFLSDYNLYEKFYSKYILSTFTLKRYDEYY